MLFLLLSMLAQAVIGQVEAGSANEQSEVCPKNYSAWSLVQVFTARNPSIYLTCYNCDETDGVTFLVKIGNASDFSSERREETSFGSRFPCPSCGARKADVDFTHHANKSYDTAHNASSDAEEFKDNVLAECCCPPSATTGNPTKDTSVSTTTSIAPPSTTSKPSNKPIPPSTLSIISPPKLDEAEEEEESNELLIGLVIAAVVVTLIFAVSFFIYKWKQRPKQPPPPVVGSPSNASSFGKGWTAISTPAPSGDSSPRVECPVEKSSHKKKRKKEESEWLLDARPPKSPTPPKLDVNDAVPSKFCTISSPQKTPRRDRQKDLDLTFATTADFTFYKQSRKEKKKK